MDAEIKALEEKYRKYDAALEALWEYRKGHKKHEQGS